LWWYKENYIRKAYPTSFKDVSPPKKDKSKDIHAGVYGHHASSRAIAAKAFRAGFYWLTAIEDAKDIV
jgi:hypothetical protein